MNETKWSVAVQPLTGATDNSGVSLCLSKAPTLFEGEPAQEIRVNLTRGQAFHLANLLKKALAGRDGTEGDDQHRCSLPTVAVRPEPSANATPFFTKTQGNYLRFIYKYQQRFGGSPAESDIQRHFLVSAPSVNNMIQRLEAKQLISRVPGQARSIRLLVTPEMLGVE
ncbi:MAG: hypothetical protein WCO56_04445 [Verrucomicrobiota bacterium]